MAILLKSTGEVQEVSPRNGHHFNIQEFYKILDATEIEFIDLPDGHRMIADDRAVLGLKIPIDENNTRIMEEKMLTHKQLTSYIDGLHKKNKLVLNDIVFETMETISGNVLIGTKDEIL